MVAKLINVNTQKLRDDISAQGWKYNKLADEIGVKSQDLYNIFKRDKFALAGKNQVIKRLELICQKLGKPIEEFLVYDADQEQYRDYKIKQDSKILPASKTPYDPLIYRDTLELVEELLSLHQVQLTKEVVSNVHDEVYNFAVEHNKISRDFADGIIRSAIKYNNLSIYK